MSLTLSIIACMAAGATLTAQIVLFAAYDPDARWVVLIAAWASVAALTSLAAAVRERER